MKIPKELKDKIKIRVNEIKKLDNMQPNRQIGRAMHGIVHTGVLHDKIKNHPKMAQLLEEHNRILDSKPFWYEDDYIKFEERYCKKALKIMNSILTDEDNITVFREVLKYSPAELKQLELYQDSKDYWTDRL